MGVNQEEENMKEKKEADCWAFYRMLHQKKVRDISRKAGSLYKLKLAAPTMQLFSSSLANRKKHHTQPQRFLSPSVLRDKILQKT